VQHFRETLKGTGRVLELGCGTGLAGLCLRELGYDVTLTDAVVDLAAINAERCGGGVEVRELSWGDCGPGDVPEGGLDYVVGSEVTPMLGGHADLCKAMGVLLEGGALGVLSVDVKDGVEEAWAGGGGWAREVGGEAEGERFLGKAALAFLTKCCAAGLVFKVAAVEKVDGIVNLEEGEGCVAAIVYLRTAGGVGGEREGEI
jgi:hypothetical protein